MNTEAPLLFRSSQVEIQREGRTLRVRRDLLSQGGMGVGEFVSECEGS